MDKNIRVIVYGVVAWLVPFLASFAFYTPQGQLSIDVFLFKSIMIVVGSITAALLLLSHFKPIRENYLREGILVGVVWLALNLLLDVLVLLPMSGMPLREYFTRIGLGYIVMPVMAILVGAALANKK
jgi:hypothetical protein